VGATDVHAPLVLELRHTWRDDLLAFATPSVLLLSPPARAGDVGRLLAALAAMDATLGAWLGSRPGDARPVTVLLLQVPADREPFFPKTGSPPSTLTATLAEQRVLVWAPQAIDSPDAGLSAVLARAVEAWLRPFGAPRHAGWLVRGLGSALAEGALLGDGRGLVAPESIDIVGQLDGEALLPWDTALAPDSAEPATQPSDPTETPVSQLRVWWRWALSGPMLAREQAAALVRYLLATDGANAEGALRRYLLVDLDATRAPLELATVFGASPSELGARTQAWCRKWLERRRL
jgi:hypothetical protein